MKKGGVIRKAQKRKRRNIQKAERRLKERNEKKKSETTVL